MHPWNPTVSVATRRWLSTLAETSPDILDLTALTALWPAFRACADKHPGGLMVDVGLALGGLPEEVMAAASAGEIFYAACSCSDDIQDGDADRYLAGGQAMQINVQGHLLALIALRIESLGAWHASAHACVTDAYRVLATMITGQRAEIARDPWDAETYARVAQLSAGVQVGWYVGLVAWIVGVRYGERERIQAWGRALGTLLQVAWDRRERDERLLDLPPEEARSMIRRMQAELRGRTGDLPEAVRALGERVTAVVCADAVA